MEPTREELDDRDRMVDRVTRLAERTFKSVSFCCCCAIYVLNKVTMCHVSTDGLIIDLFDNNIIIIIHSAKCIPLDLKERGSVSPIPT